MQPCMHAASQTSTRPPPTLGPSLLSDTQVRCVAAVPAVQELHGVARFKVADLLSIKLLPRPLLKLGGAWSLPGTGMALRLKYEVPLAHLGEFWTPPARIMVR